MFTDSSRPLLVASVSLVCALAACSESASGDGGGAGAPDGSGASTPGSGGTPGDGGSSNGGDGGDGSSTVNTGGSLTVTIGEAADAPVEHCPYPFATAGSYQSLSKSEGGSQGDGGDEVPLFVALGHGDRTIVSCDDGKTWVADQYCSTVGIGGNGQIRERFSEATNRAMGLGYTEGHFVKYIGWNGDSYAMSSTDGVRWDLVMSRDVDEWVWQGDAGGGVFNFTKRYSSDFGKTWLEPTNAPSQKPRTAWADYDGGRWISFGGSGVAYSTDGAKSYTASSLTSGATAECFKSSEAVAFGAGRFVSVGTDGQACWSSDGGATWQGAGAIGDDPGSVVWFEDRFLAFLRTDIYESANGESWSVAPGASGWVDFASVAVSDAGTLIGVDGQSLQVEKTRVYRSADGVTWEELQLGAFPDLGGDLRFVRYGKAKKPAACP